MSRKQANACQSQFDPKCSMHEVHYSKLEYHPTSPVNKKLSLGVKNEEEQKVTTHFFRSFTKNTSIYKSFLYYNL